MLLFLLLPPAPPPPPPPIFCLPVPHPAALTLAPASLFDCNGTANKMNGALDHSDQPDPDAIKMFVGQIPRSWSEKELKELFEPYGAVYQINVLRDRSQNPPQSKGTDSRALAHGLGACSPGLRGLGWGSWLFTGREEGEKDPPRCPCAPWPTGSSQRPCLPPGQVDQLASDAGREEQGAAAPLSRRVIPP